MPTATLAFVPANGTLPGDGSGLVVTFASDGTSSVGPATQGTDADGNTNFAASLTDAGDGTVSNISGVVANVSGATLLDADGSTAFIQPSPVAYTASTAPPAQATTATITVA